MAVFTNILVHSNEVVDITFFNGNNEPINVVTITAEKIPDVVGNLETHYEFAEAN